MAELIEREAALEIVCRYCALEFPCEFRETCGSYQDIRRLPAVVVTKMETGKGTCGDCRNFIRNPGKASGFCARKTAPLRYYGQRPEMQKTCRSRPRCKKLFEAREEPQERVSRTCRYHRDYGNRMVCFGQKDAPPVDPDETCESWKTQEGTA